MVEPNLTHPEYWLDDDEEHESCAELNGANGDCPINRDTCRGCRWNK
jgi:hypothetical protein